MVFKLTCEAMLKPTSLAVLLAIPACAFGGDWSGELAAGYLATSGNSSTRALNAKAQVGWTQGPWKNVLLGSAINTAERGAVTAERYLTTDKLTYDFAERNYVFLALEFEKDLFGGIRTRSSETAGYGRHFLSGPVHKLDGELGAGARQTEEQLTRDHHDDAVGRAALIYGWKISDTSAFSQLLKSESGRSNTLVESTTELKLEVIGRLAAALSYTVKYNTHVPEGVGKTDTFTAVNLSYGFGTAEPPAPLPDTH